MTEDIPETTIKEVPLEESPPEETTSSAKFDVIYSCLRCGTNVANTELARLPEIKCICGFRVFTKIRAPIVKTVKGI
jgi:DNA-directed RNA polymerase subunit P